MRYAIARKIQTQEAVQLNKILELSQENYDYLFSEEDEIRNLLTIKELFRITQINHNTIKRFFEDYDKKMRASRILIDPILHLNRIRINSDFMNYLFSFRTYLDHCLTLYSRQYGSKSDEINDFKSLCSQLFDENFEYRFFYKLRNFTQHCGLPIEIFKTKFSIREGKYDIQICCQIDPKQLLKKYDEWGNIVKPELKSKSKLNNKIDVLTSVNNFNNHLKYLDNYFESICEKHILPIKQKLLELINPETSLENLCITYFNAEGQTLIIDSVIKYIEHIETAYQKE